MALLSGWTLALLVCVTAAALTVAIVVVPSRRRLWVRRVLSAVALVVCFALVAVSGFVALNRELKWFRTWGEIFAAGTGQPGAASTSGQPTGGQRGLTWKVKPTALQANPATSPEIGAQLTGTAEGQFVEFRLSGASGVTSRVIVWLPPGYQSSTDTFYPVVLAFGGYPTDIATFKGLLDARVLAEANQGRVRPPIIVMPDAMPTGHDSECADGLPELGGKPFETWLTADLTSWIRNTLRTIDEPRGWATMGFSAGGWCASSLAVRHPHRFGLAANIAGYFSLVWSPGQRFRPVGDTEYDILRTLRDKAPDIGVYYEGAEGDRESIESFRAAEPSFRSPTRLTRVVHTGGGHNPALWNPGFSHAFAWLGASSPYFAPVR